MRNELKESLMNLLDNWKQMQFSDLENIEIDANRFGESFYSFIDQIRNWMGTIDNKPNLNYALQMPEIVEMLKEIPEPLHINFETELDFIIHGQEVIEDSSYFG